MITMYNANGSDRLIQKRRENYLEQVTRSAIKRWKFELH